MNPSERVFIELINRESIKLISVVSYVKTSFVVLGRKGDEGLSDLALFAGGAAIESVAVDRDQAALAVEAFRHFGRGRHPARLNIGDCFAYALGDFALSDIIAV